MERLLLDDGEEEEMALEGEHIEDAVVNVGVSTDDETAETGVSVDVV